MSVYGYVVTSGGESVSMVASESPSVSVSVYK